MISNKNGWMDCCLVSRHHYVTKAALNYFMAHCQLLSRQTRQALPTASSFCAGLQQANIQSYVCTGQTDETDTDFFL